MVNKSASNNSQSDHENRVVSQFTQLLEVIPEQLTKADPPAADFLIKDAAGYRYVELAQYREQGAYNEAYDRDWLYKHAHVEAWIHDPKVNTCSVALSYKKKGDSFLIPAGRDGKHQKDVIADLKKIVIDNRPLKDRANVSLRFASDARVARYTRLPSRHRWISESMYPLASEFFDSLRIMRHDDLQLGLPRTSLDQRFTGFDYSMVERLIINKAAKLLKYRSIAGHAPVILLLYSDGTHPCGRTPYFDFNRDTFFGRLREMLRQQPGQFDQVFWGNDLLTSSASLHCLT
ncbi:MAG: hypothetical protein HZA51_00390 [Planctomycetes bacterium]|nr:hypothetical protein [Planctomycetota bacterium]